MEYQYEWDLPGRLPLQLELVCALGAKGQELRHVFWIPPRQNPEVFMRQLQQAAGAGTGGEEGQPEVPETPETSVPGGEGSGRPIPSPEAGMEP